MNGRHAGWPRFLRACGATAVVFVALLALAACGGSSGSNQQPPPPQSFTIVVTPSAPSVAPGTSSTVQVSVTPENGFSGTVTVSTSGLPSGLTATPASFSVQSNPQTVALAASSSLANGDYSFSFDGTSGTLSSSTKITIGVGPLQGFIIIQPLISEVVSTFGSTTQVQLQTEATGQGVTNYQLNFAVSGLPTGVNATFSPNPVAVGSAVTMNVTAPPSGQWIQNTPIEVVATPTASVPTQSLPIDLVVAPPPGNLPNNRSDYLRTDETPESIVYDPVHQLIFSSDFSLNRVDVVSTTTRQIVRSIPVMCPDGLALSLDGTEVLVGSHAQQITAISTSSLQVVQQWALPRLSGVPYGPRNVYPLSNGEVGIQSAGVNGGSWTFSIWDPVKNTLSPVSLKTGFANDFCYASASADGAHILLADCTTETVALYTVSTGKFTKQTTFPPEDYIYGAVLSPDGSRALVYDYNNGVALYNSQLSLITYLVGPTYIDGFVFSGDSSRAYLAVPGILGVFDGTTGAFINIAPALGTIPPGAEIVPSPFIGPLFASDSTGVVYGAADHGIAFHDSTYAVNYLAGFDGAPSLDLTLTPSYGPINAATPVSFPEVVGFDAVPDVWFAGTRATQVSLGPGPAGSLSATTPPLSQPGPVSVKVIQPDGVQEFSPLVFSDGPGVMFVSGNSASPKGGAASDIIGVGLPTDPTQITVTVGGQSAAVLSAKSIDFYGVDFPFSYPYPVVDVKITLPPGTGDQDLVLTTSAGSATVPKGIHYAQSVADYASSDTFQAILLDRKRNQLYLSAGDHIDVFALSSMQFVSPFTPPALNGAKSFYGMALTPDSSELVVANYADGSVALINPDQPSSAKAVQIVPVGTSGNPYNVVTTNTGAAFVEPTDITGGTATSYELNLTTLAVTAITNIPFFSIYGGSPIAASADGSKVLLTDYGFPEDVAVFDSASGSWSVNGNNGPGTILNNLGSSAAASFNASVLGTGAAFVDASADVTGFLAWQDVFEANNPYRALLPLEKIPDGGSLAYLPYAGWVDIFDVNHGALLRRFSLAEQVQNVTDAMAVDAYGQNIYLITNAGLTIVQLANAPLAMGSVAPPAGSAGTTVTVRGSGFQATTAVTVGGTAAASTLVDANTLQIVIPEVSAGPVQITVSSPSGESYSLDNAFTVQ